MILDDWKGRKGRRYRGLRAEGMSAARAFGLVKHEETMSAWERELPTVTPIGSLEMERYVIDFADVTVGKLPSLSTNVMHPCGIGGPATTALARARARITLSVEYDEDRYPPHEWGELVTGHGHHKANRSAAVVVEHANGVPTWYVPDPDCIPAAPKGMARHDATLYVRRRLIEDGQMLLPDRDRNVYGVSASVEIGGHEIGSASCWGIEVGDGWSDSPYVLDVLRDVLADAVHEAETHAVKACEDARAEIEKAERTLATLEAYAAAVES